MSRRTPQYVRCDLCSHTWVIAWLPMVRAGDLAKVLQCTACPMCASDESYHKLLNDPAAVQAAAAACTDPPIKVTLTLDVQSNLAADMRLFLCKVQLGDPRSACQHQLAVTFLNKLPQLIDNAAGYMRAQHRLAEQRVTP